MVDDEENTPRMMWGIPPPPTPGGADMTEVSVCQPGGGVALCEVSPWGIAVPARPGPWQQSLVAGQAALGGAGVLGETRWG